MSDNIHSSEITLPEAFDNILIRYDIHNMSNGFNSGRNGTDALSAFLVGAALVIAVAASVAAGTARIILSAIALVLAIIAIFRIFSTNVARRRYENETFLSIFRSSPEAKERKAYRFFTCPECKTKCRVPRGKGKIKITCPSCGHQFIKRT